MQRVDNLRRNKLNSTKTLVGLNIFVIVLGFTEFFAPISGDTSIYAYYGRKINEGLVLYRDLWDFKSPGIYYLFALLFKLFSDSLLTLRIATIVANILASSLIYLVSRPFFSTKISLTSSAIYLVVTNLGGYFNQDGPYPETYFPILGLMGFYFWIKFIKNSDARRNIFFVGVFAGLLLIMKQTSISFFLASVTNCFNIFIIFHNKRDDLGVLKAGF